MGTSQYDVIQMELERIKKIAHQGKVQNEFTISRTSVRHMTLILALMIIALIILRLDIGVLHNQSVQLNQQGRFENTSDIRIKGFDFYDRVQPVELLQIDSFSKWQPI